MSFYPDDISVLVIKSEICLERFMLDRVSMVGSKLLIKEFGSNSKTKARSGSNRQEHPDTDLVFCRGVGSKSTHPSVNSFMVQGCGSVTVLDKRWPDSSFSEG